MAPRVHLLLCCALSLAAVVAAPVVWAGPVIHRYGIGGASDGSLGLFMSPGWYVVSWLATAPLLVLAAETVVRGHPWAATCCVTVAVFALAWVGTLPVWLRFFGTQEPVTFDALRMAACSYALLLVGAAVISVAWAFVTPTRSG